MPPRDPETFIFHVPLSTTLQAARRICDALPLYQQTVAVVNLPLPPPPKNVSDWACGS